MSKLESRMKEYDIPEVPYQPIHDNVIIYRIPPKEVTAGGLFLPDAHVPHDPIGVLLAWSGRARDVLESQGLELGELVWFAAFAGDEREVYRVGGQDGKQMLFVEYHYIQGSVDLKNALQSGKYQQVKGPDGRYTLLVPKKKAA